GHVALLPKPIAKTGRCKRLPELGHQEGQVSARGRLDNGTQRWMHRNSQLNAGRLFCLSAYPIQNLVLNVLPTHRDHVLTSLAREQPESETTTTRGYSIFRLKFDAGLTGSANVRATASHSSGLTTPRRLIASLASNTKRVLLSYRQDGPHASAC